MAPRRVRVPGRRGNPGWMRPRVEVVDVTVHEGGQANSVLKAYLSQALAREVLLGASFCRLPIAPLVDETAS